MENWKKDSRKDIVMVDVDGLVPQTICSEK